MSENTNPLNIPNAYKRLHPVDRNLSEDKEDLRPAGVEFNTTIKYILRSGDKGQSVARRMWWGDTQGGEDESIVAYKVIKLESPWVEWGHKYDRGISLNTRNGIPEDLNPETRVFVWLRNYPRPQEDSRRAEQWDWTVEGQSGSDIMKYRVVQ